MHVSSSLAIENRPVYPTFMLIPHAEADNEMMTKGETGGPTFRPISGSVLIALSLLALGLVLYVLWELRSLIGTMIIASLIAYALSPVVSRLERAGVNRTLGVMSVTAVMVAAVVLVLLIFIPTLYRETAELATQIPGYFEKARAAIGWLWERAFGKEMPSDVQSFIDILAPQADRLQAIAGKAASPIGAVIAGTFRGIAAFVLWLVGIAIMPVIVFYLLRDFDRITAGAVALIPEERRDLVVGLFTEINSTLGKLIRGQLLVALILSVLYCAGLRLIGVPYWPLLGFISGFANLIPYSSFVIGMIPSAIVAGFNYDPWWLGPIWVILLFAVVQTLEGLLITPKIVGERVGLHPLLIILALLVGGTLGGPVGVILAVPCAAVLKVVFSHFYKKVNVQTASEEPETEQEGQGGLGSGEEPSEAGE